MRPGACFLAVLALSSTGLSAQKVPGRISAEKLPGWVREAAERTIPKTEAPVVWLHDALIVEPLVDGGVRETRRRVGRLLERHGKDTISDRGIVYGGDDTVESVNAWTLLPDGSARRALQDERRGDIVDLPYTPDESVFEDKRLRIAVAPGVVPGAIVAHESVVIRDLDLGAEPFSFGHADEPTVRSVLELRVPGGWTWKALAERGHGIAEERIDGGVRFVAENLARLPHEERRPPVVDLLPRVHVRWSDASKTRGFETWDDVGKWEHALGAPVLDEPGSAATIASKLAPGQETALLEAIARAFEYASQEIRYVSIQIGIGGFKPSTPDEVARRGYGDCKDKAYLLQSLVDAWGVRTYPVLVRTRSEGVLPDVPTPGAFNHMIAAVEIPPGTGEELWSVVEVEGLGRLLLLDGTSNGDNAWNLPTMDQGTRALVVHAGGGKLIDIPVQPPQAAEIYLAIEATVDPDAKLVTAQVRRKISGGSAVNRRDEEREWDTAQRLRARLDEAQRWFPGTTVTDYRVEGFETPGEPIVETIDLSDGRAGEIIEDLLILEPGRPAGALIAGALPPPPRKWELKLPGPRRHVTEVRIRLPSDWVPEALPPPLDLDSVDLSANSSWELDGETLVFRRRAELLTQRIPAERYAAFRQALMRLGGANRRGIVLIPAEH